METDPKVAPSKTPHNTGDVDKPKPEIEQTSLYDEPRKRWIRVDPYFIPLHRSLLD